MRFPRWRRPARCRLMLVQICFVVYTRVNKKGACFLLVRYQVKDLKKPGLQGTRDQMAEEGDRTPDCSSDGGLPYLYLQYG